MILARFSVTCCFSCVCFWKFMLLFEIDYSSGRAVFVIVGYLKAVVIVGYLEAVGGRPSRSKWGGQSQFPSPSASTCLEEASPTHASPFHPSTLRSSSTSSDRFRMPPPSKPTAPPKPAAPGRSNAASREQVAAKLQSLQSFLDVFLVRVDNRFDSLLALK